MATGGNDAILEGKDFLHASFFLTRARGFFYHHMVGAQEFTYTANSGDLAHLGHGCQTTCEFANDFFFVSAQFSNVQFGGAKVHTQIGHVTDFVYDCGNVQQSLGRNATHVQTHATQGGIALNDHNLEAQISGTESSGVTTRARSQNQQITFNVDCATV